MSEDEVRRDIIVVGASAGGVEALSAVVAGLPTGLSAAIFVVLHLPAGGKSYLPQILSRAGDVPAVKAADGMPIEYGKMYVAPPNHHLLLTRDRIELTFGPKENGSRPAIDPLFRSAAHTFGRRVAGVILTGSLDDGTLGLAMVGAHGGATIVQDPGDAAFPSMPASAAQAVKVDYCLPAYRIPPVLVRLAGTEGGGFMPARSGTSPMDEAEGPLDDTGERGIPSVYTCPECSGTLFERHEGRLEHYRCRVGHAYSPGNLVAAQSMSVEAALWTALRTVEEKQSMSERLALRAQERGQGEVATRFEGQAREAAGTARVLGQLIEQRALPLDDVASLEA